MTTQIAQLFTVADLKALPEDGKGDELTKGELFVSRAPHLLHQLSLKNVLRPLLVYPEESPTGAVVSEPGVVLSEHDAVQTDIGLKLSEAVRQSHSLGWQADRRPGSGERNPFAGQAERFGETAS
ncbi:MAG: hypothetical protein C4334_09195 [Pyrinomonas sp.]|uniref:hypothetical protein n=1 Tax=Pyrinomonas sp. TaxID=2080306 RepID=UPI0033186E4A